MRKFAFVLLFTAAVTSVQMPASHKSKSDAEKIESALQAGPKFVTQNATVIDYPTSPDGEFRVLRAGTNGWTCLPGYAGAVIATRDLDLERSEIVTLSWWKNEAAIKAFAGDDISRSRYYPEDDRYLLTHPESDTRVCPEKRASGRFPRSRHERSRVAADAFACPVSAVCVKE